MTAGADALPIELADVHAAADRLRGIAHRTPVLRSRTLDTMTGAQVHLKAENLQRAGAFKFRGAYNTLASMEPEVRARGVCAVSSGNHGGAVTLAAALHGTRAVVLMPTDAPALKRAATEGYGAEVITFDRYRDDREALAVALSQERGLTLVHPYDNPLVMAGQGTVALELIEDADIDVLLVPVGGGGLISGCSTVIASLSPETEVIGVEPEASDDLVRSLQAGERVGVTVGPTIADGQQTRIPGALTWPVIARRVSRAVTVSDDQIVAAMRFAFERCKLVVEPSGASALAALLTGVVSAPGARVGVILSGGNVGAEGFAALIG